MSGAGQSGGAGPSGMAAGAAGAGGATSELEQLRREVEALRAEVADLRQRRRFAELEVERLNVVEPDGTMRLAVSNRARFPAPVVEGRQGKRSGRPLAGVVFYNDDGDECGALYGYGRTVEDGTWEAGGGLNIDQYRPQEQVVGLNYGGRDGRNTAGLRVWERVHGTQVQFPDQESIDASMIGRPYATRVFAGRTSEGVAVVRLTDSQGRLRLRLAVSPEGDPSIELLDATGNVTWRMPAAE
ncbi:MAG TPA: hypothetical protein VHS99_18920 [Chloroflexota bacterium]|nr:hypothetical protein [Chloroflexota bacterium]